jgi:hypothetical protein
VPEFVYSQAAYGPMAALRQLPEHWPQLAWLCEKGSLCCALDKPHEVLQDWQLPFQHHFRRWKQALDEQPVHDQQ